MISSLQGRFTLWLVTAFSVLLIVASYIAYQGANESELAHSYREIEQIIHFVDSTQEYVRHTARPKAIQSLSSQEFVPELMSTSFIARKVMDRFLTKFPDYHFRFATEHPHNPANLADANEREIIALFRDDPLLSSWRGKIYRNGAPYLSVALPIRFTSDCLSCHGKVEDAPKALQENYTQAGGFNLQKGEIAIKIVGIPLSITFASAMQDTYLLWALIVLIMLLILFIAVRLFRRFVSQPISHFQAGAQRIQQGEYETDIVLHNAGEFEGLAGVFNDMSDSVRNEIELHAQAEQKISRDYDSQRALREVIEVSLYPATLEEKFIQVLEIISAVPWLPVKPMGCIFIYNQEQDHLIMAAAVGLTDEIKTSCATISPGECLCGLALQNKEMVFASGIDHRHDQELTSMLPHGHYCVPILNGSRALGVLNIYLEHGHSDSPEERALLTDIANTLAGVIERHDAEVALRNSEERYALAAKGANDGLWDWDLVRERLYVSPRWSQMLGEEELSEQSPDFWLNRVHPDDHNSLQTAIDDHLVGKSENFSCHYQIQMKDGSWRWMLSRGLAIRDEKGRPIRFAGSQTDITEQKLAEERLAHNAFHDELTGLANRALLIDRLNQMLAHTQRHPDYRFALLFLDLDRFKTINDSLGHTIGDLLLTTVAHRLQQILRPGDSVARLGGDEFVLLLDDISDVSDTVIIAKRIQEQFKRPFHLGEREVFSSFSLGITLSDGRYRVAEELLRDADNAMYRAKGNQDKYYQIFDSGMHEQAMRNLQMEMDLGQAIGKGEIVPFFQPILEMESKKVIGFEALARWQHPQQGLISPIEFIPLAEESGLIIDIGEEILTKSCIQLKKWNDKRPDEMPFYVSVNLSGRQLQQENFVEVVDGIMQQTGMTVDCLRLEVTESLLIENNEQIKKQLKCFKERGIGLYLDDFGTGYSSLSYLQQFSFDTLKIDRSFVRQINKQDNDTLVQVILDMAAHFGMTVVAEGVEDLDQSKRLVQLGCARAQGFMYSKPLAAEQLTDYLLGKADYPWG
jgi:diguanylate cyclase (GGDEF)-like protein/PAS domain S-box-containing protein